jgi:hypothetical protein
VELKSVCGTEMMLNFTTHAHWSLQRIF